MRMSELEKHAQICLQYNEPLQVLISLPNCDSPELIINPPENITEKMDYYTSTYDENCKHKHAEGIEIVDVVYPEKLNVGEAILPYNSSILENHIRVEDSYVVGERSKSRVYEGKVEDVLKSLEFFKEVNAND